MKVRQRNQWFSFLLALAMIVGMLLPMSTVHAANDGEDAVSVTQEPARASSRVYPTLTNLIEGTEIRSGYQYSFYKNGKVDEYFLYANIDPEKYRYNESKCRNYKSDTNLQRVVTYTDGVLMYWTRFENDFLDLSGLEGKSLTLILFDNLKLSALYAPGVDLRLMVTDGVYVTFNHSTRYKNKTAYCPQNGATGRGDRSGPVGGKLDGCGTFELCGNGELGIVTTRCPQENQPRLCHRGEIHIGSGGCCTEYRLRQQSQRRELPDSDDHTHHRHHQGCFPLYQESPDQRRRLELPYEQLQARQRKEPECLCAAGLRRMDLIRQQRRNRPGEGV